MLKWSSKSPLGQNGKKEIDLDENTDRISRKSTIQADFETQTENSLLVWKFNVKKVV